MPFVLEFDGAFRVLELWENLNDARDSAWWWVNKFVSDNNDSEWKGHFPRDEFDMCVLQGTYVYPRTKEHYVCISERELQKGWPPSKIHRNSLVAPAAEHFK